MPMIQETWEEYLIHKSIVNKAMSSIKMSNNGGIDLTPANINLQEENKDGRIYFHIDSAMLKQLQGSAGFVPVNISIQSTTKDNVLLWLTDPTSPLL